jgi:hypothetical protein
MAVALRPRRNWASMKARWGSHRRWPPAQAPAVKPVAGVEQFGWPGAQPGRWPPRGSLNPGRIALGLKALSPGADGVAGDAGAALDLALGVTRAQERPDGGL